LEETVETYHVEHIDQKTRKVVEAKTREEAEKRRLVEEEKKKKNWNISNNSRMRY